MNNFFSLDENFNEIISIALKKEFNIDKVNQINVISTGWTNIVYEVETDQDNYFFRFPRDDFWSRTIVKDYEFAKFINGKTQTKTVDLHLGNDNGRYFSIHKKIPGVPLAERMDNLSKEDVEKVSNQIAKFMYELHNIEYDRKHVFSEKINNIGHDLNDFIDELLEKHVSKEDTEFWKNNNFKIEKNECLVHGDLNSSNVLLDENNNVTAIIDFGFGGFGNKYHDIGRIIGRCPNNFKEPIAKAYAKFEAKDLDSKELDKNIDIWSNIDSGYINYMRKIGIYE